MSPEEHARYLQACEQAELAFQLFLRRGIRPAGLKIKPSDTFDYFGPLPHNDSQIILRQFYGHFIKQVFPGAQLVFDSAGGRPRLLICSLI